MSHKNDMLIFGGMWGFQHIVFMQNKVIQPKVYNIQYLMCGHRFLLQLEDFFSHVKIMITCKVYNNTNHLRGHSTPDIRNDIFHFLRRTKSYLHNPSTSELNNIIWNSTALNCACNCYSPYLDIVPLFRCLPDGTKWYGFWVMIVVPTKCLCAAITSHWCQLIDSN